MKIQIRKDNNGLYEAMGKWLVSHHNENLSDLVTEVYKTYEMTPKLHVEKLNQDSFEYPHPENGTYKPLFSHEIRTIDEAIQREIIKYKN